MRGQEDIIALVMILMIVVALAGFAYIWFSGIFSQLMEVATAAITKTAGTMTTQIKLENVVYVTSDQKIYIVLRNTGTQSFNAANSAFYIDDIPETATSPECPNCDCNSLSQGCIAKYNISMVSLPPKSILRVTIETGLQDVREIKIV